MKTLKALLTGLIILVLVVFVAQNLEALTYYKSFKLNLMFASIESPPVMVAPIFVLCFLLGFVAAAMLGYRQQSRMKKKIKSMNAVLEKKDRELFSLRNLPITVDPDPLAGTSSTTREG